MLQMGMENGENNREKISELIVHLTCEAWASDEDIREVPDLIFYLLHIVKPEVFVKFLIIS